MEKYNSIIDRILRGERQALRGLFSYIESDFFDYKEFYEIFKNHIESPRVLGLSGTPGAGKSTFLNLSLEVIFKLKPKYKIAFLLVDPASPHHGGALLGDRVRMANFYNDERVFMRSVSHKNGESGLPHHIENYIMGLSLFPFDLIIVESVGGGQTSTGLSPITEDFLLVHDPHSGDDIQTLKNGVLDICDAIFISKAKKNPVDSVSRNLVENLAKVPPIYKFDHGMVDDLQKFWSEKLEEKKTKTIKNQLFKSLLKKNILKEVSESFDREIASFKTLDSVVDLLDPTKRKKLLKKLN